MRQIEKNGNRNCSFRICRVRIDSYGEKIRKRICVCVYAILHKVTKRYPYAYISELKLVKGFSTQP